MRITFTPLDKKYFGDIKPPEQNDKPPFEVVSDNRFTLGLDYNHYQLFAVPHPELSIGSCFQVRDGQLMVYGSSLNVDDKPVQANDTVEIKDGTTIGIPSHISYLNYKISIEK